ncbi:MAG TPA: type IV pilin protein [Dokdonella sp.]|uniref:type IV pilin protein n=1 Tax=Dokdonella sp. TaxID=2291710 RepID=UPI002C42C7BA|nr:type IV pilin protein [Dokdonella sp.]HUD43251.1 type IV pilin protein [Dokdonella sp.]
MLKYRTRGFSLIELVIVIAIIAVIAAIALPAYGRYGFRARRADGHELLLRLSAAQERFYTNRNRYAADIGDLGFSQDTSESGFYVASIETANGDQTYTLTATPQGVQAADACGDLTLTSTGRRDRSGEDSNGNCW